MRQIRKSQNLTQQEFADALGSSTTAVSEIESNKYIPGGEFLTSLFRRFAINLHWLLTGDGEMYRDASAKPVDIKDLPKENMVNWLHEFWTTASDKEKNWLEIEFQHVFPEFKEWLQKQQQTKS